ncbi:MULTISPECIES: hypothetical protein [Brucella/Ochrobactrum group]|uniref:hypothetical protein n=1 Tax=Brucella/Ochrobactrum group TaxID=2826938 RepID=UPI001ADEC308|nr:MULTISPECIES: hypothetical protein [Brucella]WHS31027.1 hypothetical protein QLQ09_14385 [Brucella sp. NM4]
MKNRVAFTITNTGNPYFAGFFKGFPRMIFFQKNFTEPVLGAQKQLTRSASPKNRESSLQKIREKLKNQPAMP